MNLFSKIFNIRNQKKLIEKASGEHIFGGEKPEGFQIPENQFLAGFQYIGKLSSSDKHFDWLPFDLNLICPILLDFDYVYLDYSDPLNPNIIYPENTSIVTSAYEEIDKHSKISYESKRFGVESFGGITDDNEYDIFGVVAKPQPNFPDEPVQFPDCPITGKKMKFLVQLFSNKHLKTTAKSFIAKSEYEEKIHQHMNFWGDGSLKIFFAPASKIVAYSIQNT